VTFLIILVAFSLFWTQLFAKNTHLKTTSVALDIDHLGMKDLIDDYERGVEINLPLRLGLLDLADRCVHGGEVALEAVAANLMTRETARWALSSPGGARKMTFFMFC